MPFFSRQLSGKSKKCLSSEAIDALKLDNIESEKYQSNGKSLLDGIEGISL